MIAYRTVGHARVAPHPSGLPYTRSNSVVGCAVSQQIKEVHGSSPMLLLRDLKPQIMFVGIKEYILLDTITDLIQTLLR